MSPRIEQASGDDTVDRRYFWAKITHLYSVDDTADITVLDDKEAILSPEVIFLKCPIFYHCEPDAVKRSNGALTGSSSAFLVDDIVYCHYHYEGPVPTIVARKDLKPCGIEVIFIVENASIYGTASQFYFDVTTIKFRQAPDNTFPYARGSTFYNVVTNYWEPYFSNGSLRSNFISVPDPHFPDYYWIAASCQVKSKVLLKDGLTYPISEYLQRSYTYPGAYYTSDNYGYAQVRCEYIVGLEPEDTTATCKINIGYKYDPNNPAVDHIVGEITYALTATSVTKSNEVFRHYYTDSTSYLANIASVYGYTISTAQNVWSMQPGVQSVLDPTLGWQDAPILALFSQTDPTETSCTEGECIAGQEGWYHTKSDYFQTGEFIIHWTNKNQYVWTVGPCDTATGCVCTAWDEWGGCTAIGPMDLYTACGLDFVENYFYGLQGIENNRLYLSFNPFPMYSKIFTCYSEFTWNMHITFTLKQWDYSECDHWVYGTCLEEGCIGSDYSTLHGCHCPPVGPIYDGLCHEAFPQDFQGIWHYFEHEELCVLLVQSEYMGLGWCDLCNQEHHYTYDEIRTLYLPLKDSLELELYNLNSVMTSHIVINEDWVYDSYEQNDYVNSYNTDRGTPFCSYAQSGQTKFLSIITTKESHTVLTPTISFYRKKPNEEWIDITTLVFQAFLRDMGYVLSHTLYQGFVIK